MFRGDEADWRASNGLEGYAFRNGGNPRSKTQCVRSKIGSTGSLRNYILARLECAPRTLAAVWEQVAIWPVVIRGVSLLSDAFCNWRRRSCGREDCSISGTRMPSSTA